MSVCVKGDLCHTHSISLSHGLLASSYLAAFRLSSMSLLFFSLSP